MSDEFQQPYPLPESPPEPAAEVELAPEQKPKPKKRKKTTVGATANLVRWMMRNANKRPVSTAMIHQGVPGVRSGEIFNLKKLGVIKHVANATYQMAEEFRNVAPPGLNTRFVTRWIEQVRADALNGDKSKPKPVVQRRIVTDADLLAVLEKMMNGKLLNVRQAAQVNEWLELTRRIVA